MICESEEKPIIDNEHSNNVTSDIPHQHNNEDVEEPYVERQTTSQEDIFKSYGRRWIMLFAMFTLGFSIVIVS